MSVKWNALRPLVVAGLFVVALPAASARPDPAALDMCGMAPSFFEDFADFRVASRDLRGVNWTAHTPWNGDFGDARFADPGPGGPFSVSGGALHITARKGRDGRWQSGLIAAADGTGRGHGVRYGYFEARMRMPAGPGTWPAFWLGAQRPASDKRPSLELDVIEYYGKFTDGYHVSYHLWTGNKATESHTGSIITVPRESLVREFHDYGLKITPRTIGYYFDRRLVWQTATPKEHVYDMYPIVNLALGSGYPIDQTPDPSVLDVKYVHVFRLDTAAHCG